MTSNYVDYIIHITANSPYNVSSPRKTHKPLVINTALNHLSHTTRLHIPHMEFPLPFQITHWLSLETPQ